MNTLNSGFPKQKYSSGTVLAEIDDLCFRESYFDIDKLYRAGPLRIQKRGQCSREAKSSVRWPATYQKKYLSRTHDLIVLRTVLDKIKQLLRCTQGPQKMSNVFRRSQHLPSLSLTGSKRATAIRSRIFKRVTLAFSTLLRATVNFFSPSSSELRPPCPPPPTPVNTSSSVKGPGPAM